MGDRVNMQKQLLGKLAYGTITRGNIPGDLKDYTVELLKETYKNSSIKYKLEFTPNTYSQTNFPFVLNLDSIKQPNNSLYLLKIKQTQQGGVQPIMKNKIQKKMNLSIKKEEVLREQMNENEKQSSEDDSDIPKRRYANLSNFFRDMEQSSEEEPRRKRYKRSFDD